MPARVAPPLAVALAASLALGGCFLFPSGQERCAADDNCRAGFACVDGVCAPGEGEGEGEGEGGEGEGEGGEGEGEGGEGEGEGGEGEGEGGEGEGEGEGEPVVTAVPVVFNDWRTPAFVDAPAETGANTCSATPGGAARLGVDCIHMGERPRVVVDGVASCAGITASDSFARLQWTCRVDPNAADRVFVEGAFLPGVGLHSFINDVGALAPDQVTVRRDGIVIGGADAYPLQNRIVLATPVTLANVVEGDIVVFNADSAIPAYAIPAPRVAVLVLDGGQLGPAPPGLSALVVDEPFSWVEGRIVGNDERPTIDLVGGPAVVHEAIIEDGFAGIDIEGPAATSVLVRRTRVLAGANNGITISNGAAFVEVIDSAVAGRLRGVQVLGDRTGVRLRGVSASACNDGIAIEDSSDVWIGESTVIGNNVGVRLLSGGNVVHGLTALRNNVGIEGAVTVGAEAANRLQALFVSQNGTGILHAESTLELVDALITENPTEIRIIGAGTIVTPVDGVRFDGSPDCLVDVDPGVSCDFAVDQVPGGAPTATPLFLGVSGPAKALDAFTDLSAGVHFGLANFDGTPGPCTVSCAPNDARLSINDSAARAQLAFDLDGLAPRIRGALELVGDNGTCEPGVDGEVCLVAPNFGGYQGRGALELSSLEAGATLLLEYLLNGEP